jgi:hypothetical protein
MSLSTTQKREERHFCLQMHQIYSLSRKKKLKNHLFKICVIKSSLDADAAPKFQVSRALQLIYNWEKSTQTKDPSIKLMIKNLCPIKIHCKHICKWNPSVQAIHTYKNVIKEFMFGSNQGIHIKTYLKL